MSARDVLILAALLAAPAAYAQESECDESGWFGWRGGPMVRVCAVRELTLPGRGQLTIDAGANGSISVDGESRRDVQVRAIVQAWAGDRAEAERIASAVNVRTDDGVRADGPEQRSRSGWSVSYSVLAPRDSDLALQANNGSIDVRGVRGDLELATRNGGINLNDVAGNVRGRTTNGGVDAELTGRTWEGEGLDLKTTNGGVRLRIPESYSARLETGTVNGGIDIDFPVTVQGRINREFATTLGQGGPLIRAETTNGHVRLTRDRGNLTRLPAN